MIMHRSHSTVVEKIHKILDKEKFECSSYLSGQKESLRGPLYRDFILVFLGINQDKQERILEISVTDLNPSLSASDHPKVSYYRIEFITEIVLDLEPFATTQLESLILFINHVLDWPGFDLDELRGRVFYRYVWLVKESSIEGKAFTQLIGNLIMTLDLFEEMLRLVGEGKTSFDKLLEQVLELQKQTFS